MKVRWTERALRDLQSIGRYIASDKPGAARRWVDRLQERAEASGSAPLAGRVVPETDDPAVREVFLRSYRIVYQVQKREVLVLTIFEGRQQFPLEAVEERKKSR